MSCEHSRFCYVNYQGWHHVPGCPLHGETLEREHAKRPSALAPRREPKVSLEDIEKAFERAKEGM